MIEINNNKFHYYYNEIKYKYEDTVKNIIILEIYRSNLYNKLKNYILKLRLKYLLKIYPYTQLSIYNNYVNEEYILNLLSIIIFTHKFNSLHDPIFDDISPFNKDNLENIFNNKCLINKEHNINMILTIFPYLSKKYLKYYNKIISNYAKFDNIKYSINYKINNNIISINLLIEDNKLFKNINYMKIYNFNHNYFMKITKTNSTEDITNDILERIYIMYTRYNILSSGNNQASILPDFKNLINNKLNIKIELFGSPLNIHSKNFGSFFYDCDKYFGSIGNYFNTNIISGYYELNPPFEYCLINNMFNKALNELTNAENNNLPLLFLFIIPKTYFKYNNELVISKFIKFKETINKQLFPYQIIEESADIHTNTRSIVDTTIIICHTQYIDKHIMNNCINFHTIIKKYIERFIYKIINYF